MQKMQQCMQLVDQEVITSFQDRGMQLSREIEALCLSGKHNEAQNKAIGFAMELHRSLELANYRKCWKLVPDKISALQKLIQQYHISELRFTHACDLIKP